MQLLLRSTRLAVPFAFLVASAIVLLGIGSFGIWDPWELNAAEVARKLEEGNLRVSELDVPPLAPAVIARGFALFGVHEASGRVPIALFALCSLVFAYLIAGRASGRRAGAYAVLVLASTPLFLFNARQMMGVAPRFAASAFVFWAAMRLLDGDDDPRPEWARGMRGRAIDVAALVLAATLAVLASGALTGLLPPLLAVAAVGLSDGRVAWHELRARSPRGVVATLIVVIAVAVALATARTIALDADAYSALLGGSPHTGSAPSFEVGLERVFHTFAPWSAVVPLAIASALAAPDGATSTVLSRTRLGLALWAIFGFGAMTIFEARYGSATFVPVVALSASVALYLRSIEQDRRGSWATGVVAFLLAVLLIRDFRGYPASPANALPLEGMTVPEEFNPSRAWAVVLGLFGVLAFLGFAVVPDEPAPSVRSVFRFEGPRSAVRERWNAGVGFRIWLLFALTLLCTCTIFGAICFALGEDARPFEALSIAGISGLAVVGVGALATIASWAFARRTKRELQTKHLMLFTGLIVLGIGVAIPCLILASPAVSSLAVRIGRALTFAAPLVVLVVLGFRLVRLGFQKLGHAALWPMLAAGLAVGGYTSFGFEPALSSHFSPRGIYDAYNRFAQDGEPLGEYNVGGRAAAYYARGELRELRDQNATLEFLSSPSRVWLAFRKDDLAQLNRAYRQRAERHLFIADASSARVLLATNLPIEGQENQNHLADSVLDQEPHHQHPVHANFDHRIELLGYDLDLPRGSTVGPGQAFTVTWYWKCLAPIPGSYQIFLHVDGAGQRLNGDHEPVDGNYPVRLWDQGDVVVDRQELRVPANFPPGQYTFFIGFYSGETRLDVISGPADEVDRVRAGTLNVR